MAAEYSGDCVKQRCHHTTSNRQALHGIHTSSETSEEASENILRCVDELDTCTIMFAFDEIM